MSKFEDAAREYATVTAAHDIEKLMKLYAPDAVVNDPLYPEPLRGHGAIRQDAADFFRAFPDISFKFTDVFQKNERTGATKFQISGTNTGPLTFPTGQVVPPTGKRINVVGVALVTLDDSGLIKEELRYYDTATVLRQLGLLPEPAMAETADAGTMSSR